MFSANDLLSIALCCFFLATIRDLKTDTSTSRNLVAFEYSAINKILKLLRSSLTSTLKWVLWLLTNNITGNFLRLRRRKGRKRFFYIIVKSSAFIQPKTLKPFPYSTGVVDVISFGLNLLFDKIKREGEKAFASNCTKIIIIFDFALLMVQFKCQKHGQFRIFIVYFKCQNKHFFV